MCSAKKVDMVFVHAHRLHLDFVSLLYAGNCFSDDLDNLFVKKGFPILHGENDMVMNLPCTVVPFPDSTFIVHPRSITKTPCSKLQGILKLNSIEGMGSLIKAWPSRPGE